MKATGGMPGFRYDARRKLAHFAVIVPGTKGRVRHRTTVKAATIEKARKAWSKYREDVLAGRSLVSHTVSEYLAAHWKAISARLSPAFAKIQTARLKRVKKFFGTVPLERMNLALVRDFVVTLKAEGLGPTTINHHLHLVRLILRDAVERGELADYPLSGRMPRQVEPVHRLELSDDERTRLLAAFEDEEGFGKLFAADLSERKAEHKPAFRGNQYHHDPRVAQYYFQRFRASRSFFVLAVETGLRRGDLLGLRWRSVDLAGRWIRLAQGKTKREVLVPLSAAAVDALHSCRPRSGGERVFVVDGAPFSAMTARRYFEIAKKLAKIERRLRFHDLRHTFASRLASAGVGSAVIAKALGHSSTRMVDRYARPSEEAMESIRVALDSRRSPSSMNSDVNSRAESEGGV